MFSRSPLVILWSWEKTRVQTVSFLDDHGVVLEIGEGGRRKELTEGGVHSLIRTRSENGPPAPREQRRKRSISLINDSGDSACSRERGEEDKVNFLSTSSAQDLSR